MIPEWLLLDDAADVAELLLEDVFGVARKRAVHNPLHDPDFEIILKQLFASLVRVVAPADRRALQSVQTMLDLNWPGLSVAEREKAILSIAKGLGGVPNLVVHPVEQVLNQHGPQIVAATKRNSAAYFDLPIKPNFNLVDKRVIDAARASQAHYIRNEYGVREELASARARSIVARGLERGRDRYEIAADLKPAMEAIGVNRSLGYFRMVASVFAARARTWGTLAAFGEAGIEHMEWVSMLDEATSDVCRFLDGKVFPVAAARDRHLQVAASENPEAVVELQPWVSAGKAKDGSVALFYKQGGERKPIALVERSGVGAADDRGEYSRTASTSRLIAAGITNPPAHAHCRSQVVPASAVPARVQVPAQIAGPSTTPNVLPYVGTGPQAPIIAGPAATPQQVAALVRPVQVFPAGFNPEALPEFTAEELAAQAAEEAKQKALAAALAKLAALPPGKPGEVLHGIPDLFTSGFGDPPKKPTAMQSAGVKMQKTKQALVDEVWTLFPHVNAGMIEKAIRNFDPSEPITLIKHDGKLWATGEYAKTQVLAAKLLGHTTLQTKIIDQDAAAAKLAKQKVKEAVAAAAAEAKAKAEAEAKAKAAIAAAAAKPGAKGDASNILHKQTGSAKGSNDGGFYTGADGVERYVKFYSDPAQAHCEHLSNTLYAALGHTAPSSTLFEHKGKTAYASDLFKGGKTLKEIGGPSAISKDEAKSLMKAFVADVITGNWDAVGTGWDNVMRLPDGRWARIDNGGTFLMRAKEGRKPAAALDAITEWEVFFSSKNTYYRDVAARAGYSSPDDFKDEVAEQIRRALALQKSAGSWSDYVRTHIPDCPPGDRARIIQMLDARSRLLQEKLDELTKPAPPPPAPGAARFIAKQYSTVQPAAGLKLDKLPESSIIEDHYGKISCHNPTKMPSGESYASYRKRAEAAVAKLKSDEKSAVVSFTGNGYTSIRDSEERGTPDSRSNAIHRGLRERGIAEPGTVWRGIQGLPEAVVAKHMEGAILQLGRKGGATSSTSWNIDVSIDSFMGGPGDGSPGAYKILYKINGKTQVPVETISAVGETERELMLSRDAVFRVTGLSRAKGRKYVLVVECEEIVDQEAVQAREHAAAVAAGKAPPWSALAAPGKGPTPAAAPAAAPSTGAPPPAPPTPPVHPEVTKAKAKLAALPKPPGPVGPAGPKAVHGLDNFGGKGPPTPTSMVTQAKVKAAKAKPPVLIDTSAITLADKSIHKGLIETAIQHAVNDTPLVLVKSGGKLYAKYPADDAMLVAYALAGKPVPAHIVELD